MKSGDGSAAGWNRRSSSSGGGPRPSGHGWPPRRPDRSVRPEPAPGIHAAGGAGAAASATGLNIFWVRRSELSQRLRLLPPVESADVSLELPGHLVIQVKEREPAAICLAGGTPFLVDGDGLVLAARPPSR